MQSFDKDMHAIIAPFPAYGHVNPTLRMARELIVRGHEVEYYLPERFADAVELTGATFRRLDDESDVVAKAETHGSQPRVTDEQEREQDHGRERRENIGQLVIDSANVASEGADRIAEAGPDVVVFDPMCLWGRKAVDQLDVPSVAFYSSFALREESPLLDDISFGQLDTGMNEDGSLPEPLTNTLEAQSVSDATPADFFVADADLSISPIPRVFQPDVDGFGDDYRFVGPMIRSSMNEQDADLPLDRLADRQSVYVSLGTVFHGDRAFFEACFDALAETGWDVVIKAKENVHQLDSASPENVSVRRRVPQLNLLERVDVFVTHGGMNSTMEALSFGTPLVVVPQGGDQYAVAERVTDLGLGSTLDPDMLTANDLYEEVETVHNDPYPETVESFQVTLHEAGGADRVANAVERLIRRNGN